MATASRKRTRWQTALDLDDLRARLTDVDESNPDDLLAFKRALQAVVSDLPSVSAPPPLPRSTPLTHPPTPRTPSRPSPPRSSRARKSSHSSACRTRS